MDFMAITVTRFPTAYRRQEPQTRTLGDYLDAVRSSRPLTHTKAEAPAWALCSLDGTSNGERTGLVQLDFDHVAEPQKLRELLAAYGGFIAALRSFSGAGIVALAYVGKDAEKADVSAFIVTPLLRYLARSGMTDGVDYTLDLSCLSPAQLRYESRDPEAYVAADPCPILAPWQGTDAIETHPVSMLAEALRPGDGASPAGLGAAIAAIGMTADTGSALYEGAQVYPARAFCVVIGESGCRKTSLLDAVQTAARRLGVVISDPKNAPTLREHLLACGCDEVVMTQTDASGKQRSTTTRVERESSPADPLLVVIDEAGQRLRTRVQDESCGSMAAMLRQCNGAYITLEAVVRQEHRGSYRVPAHVSALLGTTPSQWAEYRNAAGPDNGENRRILELWQPSDPGDMFSARAPGADIDTVVELLRPLQELARLYRDAKRAFIPAQEARGAFRALRARLVDAGSTEAAADSLIMGYSALLAVLRASGLGGAGVITYDDLAACAQVLRIAMESRAKLRAVCEDHAASHGRTDAEVWAEIAEWVEARPRRDKLLARLTRRPPAYRRVFDAKLRQGAVVAEKDEKLGKYVYRFATAEEAETSEATTEAARAAAHDEIAAAAANRRAYDDCDEDERETRVIKYIAAWRADTSLAPGGRNIALNKLAYMLQKNGMWDDVARSIYETVARGAGLPEDEVRSLARQRRNKNEKSV